MDSKESKASKASNAVPDATVATEIKLKYPFCVLLILGNWACESFAFYGMNTVLSMYFLTILNLSERHSSVFYHLFTGFCSLTSIMGGYVADNWCGNFNIICYVSLIFIAGMTLLCLTASPIGFLQVPFSAISLLLIAVGTGAMKPSITAFGGDQFTLPQQEKHLESYFSFFYFCVNVGGGLAILSAPIMRNRRCFGEDTCFPLAFGVPAVLMTIAVILFVVGKPWYKMPRTKGIMTNVCKCINHGLYQKCHHPKGERVAHWLDRAEDKFDKEFITDIKGVFRIVLLLLPSVVFFALYDQLGSTWTFQACRMDGNVGAFTILPEQMVLTNPILVLIMIPVFNYGVYPLLLKVGLLKRQLSRMCCGGFLLAITFAMLSAISLTLEASDPAPPIAGTSHLRIYNSLKCTPTITSPVFDAPTTIDSMDFTMTEVRNVEGKGTYEWTVENCNDLPEKQGQFNLEEKKSKGYYLSKKGMISFEDNISKDRKMSGYPKLRVLVDNPDINLELKMTTEDGDRAELRNADKAKKIKPLLNDTIQFTVRPGVIKIMDIDKVVHVKQGGVYTIFIETQDQSIKDLTMIELTKPNHISILWQLPQHFVCAAAEIMYSVTIVEFSYSQAPATMKSFVQALRLLIKFFANAFTSGFKAIGTFEKNSSDNLFFTVLMAVTMCIFAFGCRYYTYVEPRNATST